MGQIKKELLLLHMVEGISGQTYFFVFKTLIYFKFLTPHVNTSKIGASSTLLTPLKTTTKTTHDFTPSIFILLL